MYFDTGYKNECSGCSACLNACPVAAITMHEDYEGFFYPIINHEVCIECGLCHKVCSWENPSYDNLDDPQVLASVLKNKNERVCSTSGGVFFAIAQWIIKEGGVVYGAAFDNNLQLHHVSAETMDDLQKLRGSKYIQSDLRNIFKDIKQKLDDNRWCYFTGTGCQVAGLKAYLRKDYTKLITSDLVCHGVPSQKLFNEHIEYMEHKYHDKVVDYHFRDYGTGKGCEICIFAKHKSVINPSYYISPFLYSFMYGFTFRQSCYECKFAKIPRQGDVTLADFWGIQIFFPEFDNSNGVSLLLLNSKKGQWIWEQVKGQCRYEISKIKDAAKQNGNLVHHSEKPPLRDWIYKEIIKRGYKDVAENEFRNKKYLSLKVKYSLLNLRVIKKAGRIIKLWKVRK